MIRARMEVVRLSLDDLVFDENNARLHPERNLAVVKQSLLQYGQVEPLVVQASTGVVIGGNARLQCMREIGWTEASAVVLDLDDAKAKALGLVLNRSAELATWNNDKLVEVLEGLTAQEIPVIGWDMPEIQALLEGSLNQGVVDTTAGMFEPVPVEPKRSVSFTREQWDTVSRAVEKVQEVEEDKVSEAQALMTICGVYLDG
jgi:hypothetical protein